MEPFDLAMLVLRVWIGVVMLAHGVNHARSLDGTTKWFASVGFRRARLNATASAVGEIAIGAGLVLGLLTSVAAAGLIATMTVAFGAIHRFVGFFVFHRPDEGWEYVATLAAAAFAVATLGPGSVSIDAVIGLDESMSGWTGAIVALAGVVVGTLQLLVTWRRPGSDGG